MKYISVLVFSVVVCFGFVSAQSDPLFYAVLDVGDSDSQIGVLNLSEYILLEGNHTNADIEGLVCQTGVLIGVSGNENSPSLYSTIQTDSLSSILSEGMPITVGGTEVFEAEAATLFGDDIYIWLNDSWTRGVASLDLETGNAEMIWSSGYNVAAMEYSAGKIWFVDSSERLYSWIPGYPAQYIMSLGTEHVEAMAQYEGTLYIGTHGGGVYTIDTETLDIMPLNISGHTYDLEAMAYCDPTPASTPEVSSTPTVLEATSTPVVPTSEPTNTPIAPTNTSTPEPTKVPTATHTSTAIPTAQDVPNQGLDPTSISTGPQPEFYEILIPWLVK